MRTIETHEVTPQRFLDIRVVDEPGHGGACHKYEVWKHSTPSGAGLNTDLKLCEINFQNGPIKEHGVNGITQEALLAVVIDRLASFQAGPFPTFFNEMALGHLKMAQAFLHQRTRERVVRGVEGKTAA